MELTSYHQVEEFRKGQHGREDSSPHIPPISQNPHWKPSRLSDGCTSGKDPESEGLARDNSEVSLIPIKPETASHVAWPFWVPLPCRCLPGCPLPRVFFFVSMCVTSDNSSPNIRQEPTLWKGSPFLQQNPFIYT